MLKKPPLPNHLQEFLQSNLRRFPSGPSMPRQFYVHSIDESIVFLYAEKHTTGEAFEADIDLLIFREISQ
jgi:hypothetical protein